MKWIPQAIAELLAMLIAYATNWIVAAFADEYGQLPQCLKLWQTYDNPLDIDWMIYEGCVPKFARYDFNRHYQYVPEDKGDNYMIPGKVILKDPNFTLWERLQRYVCRVCWLYRNSNYGFSYYVNGRIVDGSKNIIKLDIDKPNDRRFISMVNDGSSWWSRTWCYYYEVKYCRWFRLRLYLGWKLKGVNAGRQRHMLALSFNPFKRLEAE